MRARNKGLNAKNRALGYRGAIKEGSGLLFQPVYYVWVVLPCSWAEVG